MPTHRDFERNSQTQSFPSKSNSHLIQLGGMLLFLKCVPHHHLPSPQWQCLNWSNNPCFSFAHQGLQGDQWLISQQVWYLHIHVASSFYKTLKNTNFCLDLANSMIEYCCWSFRKQRKESFSGMKSKFFVICQPLQSCECILDTSTKIHLSGSFEGESHFGNLYIPHICHFLHTRNFGLIFSPLKSA